MDGGGMSDIIEAFPKTKEMYLVELTFTDNGISAAQCTYNGEMGINLSWSPTLSYIKYQVKDPIPLRFNRKLLDVMKYFPPRVPELMITTVPPDKTLWQDIPHTQDFALRLSRYSPRKINPAYNFYPAFGYLPAGINQNNLPPTYEVHCSILKDLRNERIGKFKSVIFHVKPGNLELEINFRTGAYYRRDFSGSDIISDTTQTYDRSYKPKYLKAILKQLQGNLRLSIFPDGLLCINQSTDNLDLGYFIRSIPLKIPYNASPNAMSTAMSTPV
jgi:hypothetical protein